MAETTPPAELEFPPESRVRISLARRHETDRSAEIEIEAVAVEAGATAVGSSVELDLGTVADVIDATPVSRARHSMGGGDLNPESSDDQAITVQAELLALVTNIQEVQDSAGRFHTVVGDDQAFIVCKEGDAELIGQEFSSKIVDREVRVVEATPLGLVEAAVTFTKDPSIKNSLVHLQSQLEQGSQTEEVLQLYDTMFASIFVDDHGIATQEPNVDQLYPVVLALAGVAEAAQLLDQKNNVFKFLSRGQSEVAMGSSQYAPGEVVEDEEVLAKLEPYVGVHTSAYPANVENGQMVLRPVSSFEQPDGSKYPRSTLHWSLNHPVGSIMEGDFSQGTHTYVAGVRQLVEANGAPNVLHGVDTYWSVNPGQDLRLPDSTVLIRRDGDSVAPHFITVLEGNVISLNPNLNANSILKDYSEYVAESVGLAEKLADELNLDVFYNQDILADPSYRGEQWWDTMKQLSDELMQMLEEYLPQTGQQLSIQEYKQAVQEFLADMQNSSSNDIDMPQAARIWLLEGIRTHLVKHTIENIFSAKIAKANERSEYIESEWFKAEFPALNGVFGGGLHSTTPEAMLEDQQNGEDPQTTAMLLVQVSPQARRTWLATNMKLPLRYRVPTVSSRRRRIGP